MAAGRVEPYERLAGVYDEIVVDPCYSQWADFLVERWQSAGPGVSTVLDVCCGTGLMAAELVGRGYQVVGMDSSPAMLARAEHLLGPGTTLVAATLPDVGVAGVFDAAISTFDGLNYLPPAVLGPSLAAIATSVSPGGWFIFDLHTDAMMAFTVANPLVSGVAQGNRFTISSDVDTAARTCATTIDVVETDQGEPFSETHRQYFHSTATVREQLVAAGFGEVRRYDEYTNRPADGRTLRATWTARRTDRDPGRRVEPAPGAAEGR
jgi:SAM-dependent methyltransferase